LGKEFLIMLEILQSARKFYLSAEFREGSARHADVLGKFSP
jgi:hypothetical protein